MAKIRMLRLILVVLLVIGAMGCGVRVQNLKSETSRLRDRPSAPFPVSLLVDRVRGSEINASRSTHNPETGLAEALRKTRSFAAILTPDSRDGSADLELRGIVETQWSNQGFANFLTYFPGGLLFAPNWRGTRWQFRTTAKMELVDNRTEMVIGTYTAKTAHSLVHRSGNPAHFLGAAVVIPGVIQGSIKASRRRFYRKNLYDAAYPELWKQIATQIATDPETPFRKEAALQREKCGERFGAEPKVGELWNEFRHCQLSNFRKTRELTIGENVVTIFEDTRNRWEIYVVDGRITQWDGQPGLPTRSSSPQRY